MQAIAEEKGTWSPRTEEDKELVRRQMNRLLETSHFRNSRRYPALLRFIVEETLEGRGEFLKERLLGVHVFDRPANYDTASDPIVRVTIAEIRKRIAQYYHEPAHQAEMRIELSVGHYAPEFHPHVEAAEVSAPWVAPATNAGEKQPAAAPAPAETLPAERAGRWLRLRKYVVGSMTIAALAVGAAIAWNQMHPSALSEFWQPLFATRRTIMFCLPTAGVMVQGSTPFAADGSLKVAPTPGALMAPNHDNSFLDHENMGENVVFSDVLATLKIANFFAVQNHESRSRLSTMMTLDDLRQGPGVLIGGLDNDWTLRALANLRYRFFGDEQREFWIMDAKHPEQRDWELKLDTSYAAVQHDFAIIARVHDDNTGQMEVIVAGIGMSATAAAGAFLVDPRQLEELRRRVGPGFRDHDFEAVLSTDVVNGIAGTPKIIAVALR